MELVSGKRRGLIAALQRAALRLACWPYGWAMALRNAAYDRGWSKATKVAVPVISVGNLTAGGTGKSPFVEYLARWLSGFDLRVGTLSRGYGGHDGPNDEALVLDENLPDVPHLIGIDRVSLAETAIEELESDVLILDDGFQHRRLARDIDIVLVDATNPWGYGALLPRGLLREPPTSLRRASAIVLTRCDQVATEHVEEIEARVRRYAAHTPLMHSEHRPIAWRNNDGVELALETLRDTPVAAFCGIGNPAAFRTTLTTLGLKLADWREFPDHYRYQRPDVEELENWVSRTGCEVAVTTQKDFVKLRLDRMGGKPFFALRIGLRITKGEESLRNLIRPILPE